MVDHENILTRKFFARNFLTRNFPELRCRVVIYKLKNDCMGTLQMLTQDQLAVQYGGKSVSKLG